MSQHHTSILSCRHIDKSFDSFIALKDITFSLQKGEKIGLVGPNGTGKSTLLKIIAGILTQDAGILERGKEVSIGYIPQSFDLFAEQTVRLFLSEHASHLSPDLELHIKALGLPTDILKRNICDLSGGEKTKVAVLRILASDYDLLLLDEPTNNLDMDALIVLEDFVYSSTKTCIIVSHDRMFLDRTVTKIIGIDEHTKRATVYQGNFSDYLKTRQSESLKAWQQYDDAVDKKEKIQRAVTEKRDKATKISTSKSRDNDKMAKNFKTEMGQRTLERGARLLNDKLQKMDPIEKPTVLRPLKIQFDIAERGGDKVLGLQGVSKTLPDKVLGPVDLSVQYGDRILISGKNGTGKSTLLKIIMKQISPEQGIVNYGTRLSIGYLAQEEYFSPSATLLEIIQHEVSIDESQVRKTLNRFRITEEDISKCISELSSGERSRFTLALMMARNVNCIILDEPSNHLDLEVLSELEEALIAFEGTLIVVSHDRYFVSKLQFNRQYVLDTILQVG